MKDCPCKFNLLYIFLFIVSWLILYLVLYTQFNDYFHLKIHTLDLTHLKFQAQKETEILKFDSGDYATVVILTYRRIPLLLKLMKHYGNMNVFQEMLIVWNDIDNNPPEEICNELNNTNNTVPIRLLKQLKNDALNKIRIYTELKTQGALLLDDDVYINEKEVRFGFNMWKVVPDRLVGYVSRRHTQEMKVINGSKTFKWMYGFTDKSSNYSLLLAGAVYVHANYLKLFIEASPEVIKVVEEEKNCDDIALNFVVANYLNKPVGFFVASRSFNFLTVPANTKNAAKPLYSRPNHYTVRNYCMQKFTEIYNQMPLQYFEGKLTPFR